MSTGQILKLIIDHDEQACNPSEHDCVYVIAVFNVGSNSSLRYKIQASHNQNNHILLQERTPRIDSVGLKGFKYYKFTLPAQDQQNVSNVSIEINPLHGDADLIVSRTEMFPSKDKFDKKSSRVGSLVDHVAFARDNATTLLESSYFVAVYGFSFATYSIIVNVNRTKHDAIDAALAQSVLLYQGVPYTKTLKSMAEAFNAYFTVAIDEHDDFAILFDVQQLEHKTIAYLRYGQVATRKAYDLRVKGRGTLEIKAGDAHYHKNGTYFVTVEPDADFIDLFQDRHYSFVLQYRVLNTVPHLNSNGVM